MAILVYCGNVALTPKGPNLFSKDTIMSLSFELDNAQKEYLGRQAKLAIQSELDGDKDAEPLKPAPAPIREGAANPEDSELNRKLGSFVTITEKGQLRGCIGTIIGQEPLWLNVWNMARAAAFNDPRFLPLEKSEWPECSLEISVLDEPTRCPDPSQIEIGRDGLILQYNGHSGVFLPQVPVEQGWDRKQYLEHLCQKANLPQGSWRKPDASLFWYQALVFKVEK